MQSPLSDNQLSYVLFHLEQHVDLSPFRELVSYGNNLTSKISFYSSDNKLYKAIQLKYKNKVISVLFPQNEVQSFYSMKNGKLIFHHDLLKSAFYLLSGYQETLDNVSDNMGRYRYKNSIQHKLGVITMPLVNYYFEIIIEGLQEYAMFHGLTLKRKRLFDSFGFMLTHDVDRVDYYHWRETVLKAMQLVGLKPSDYKDKKLLLKATLEAVLPTFFPGYKKDPWWNFDELRQIEKKLDIRSVWYFLNRDGSSHDAKYILEENRIKKLIYKLISHKCEIGLHGSIKTSNSLNDLNLAKERLQNITKNEVVGTRQHFLKLSYPSTLLIQQECGLKYDSTLGFAEHEGFRNSYCYPFHPYDFENDTMMTIWEFPLAIMDTTLFGYRGLNNREIIDSSKVIIEEVKQFGGLLVLLWHNCNFNEYQHPGITDTYKVLLEQFMNNDAQSICGTEVLTKL